MKPSNIHIQRFQPRIFTDYISCLKIYEFNSRAPVKLDPKGRFEMVFQLDGNFSHNTPGTEGWEERPRQFIGGLHTKSYWIKPSSEKSRLISIEFKSAGARAFVPDKLQFYKNKCISIFEAIKVDFDQTLDKLEEAQFAEEGVNALETLLQKLYRNAKASPIEVAMELIREQGGLISIKSIANKVNLSEAQFRKRFNEEIGLSPKEFSKIERFKLATRALQQNPKMKCSQLTYDLGYFDQAHFIKDFQSVAGMTPKKYLSSIHG